MPTLRFLLWFATCIATMSCGGKSTEDDSVPSDPREGGSNTPAPHPEAPADCTVGERREPEAAEAGVSYCVCEEHSDLGKRWGCYGPDPDGPPAGGARGAGPADCGDTFGQTGTDSDCLITVGACSDGHAYSVSCIQGACFCLVDNQPTVEPEPRSGCPDELPAINERCGWALQ